MMQKIINALAILSFGGVAGIAGGGAYVYIQRDALIDSVKEQVTKAAMESVTGALPGAIDAKMPELPKTTGGVVGTPATGTPLPAGGFAPF